ASAVAARAGFRVRQGGTDRPVHAGAPGPLRHLGPARGPDRQGVPLRPDPADVAGPREHAGDAVRDPRLDGVLAAPAHAVLVVDPRGELDAGALQRVRPAPAVGAGPSNA